ncbi:MAG: PadR family transcriptional regulator [Gemmatimonadetes bacterium]|nr:PadR family transcriptional regulator [Gemmatimonadota bacterium]
MTAIEASTIYGTLNLLLLRVLEEGEQHGLEIRARIEAATSGAVKIEEGALYPALHRLERDGLVVAEWRMSERRRRAKYYRLTAKGRKRLQRESATWKAHVRAVARVVLNPDEAL